MNGEFNMDRLDTMRAFVTVAAEGSFTKAADKLDMSNQLVSKYVSDLEEHLDVRLFNRTTRQVHLTEVGEQCLQHVKQILENISDMRSLVGELQHEAKGLLQISAPVSFSTIHLTKLISDFKKSHPNVGINLQLNDRKVDVIEEGFDVALRIGKLKSSSLIAKKIVPIRLVLCASPDYIEKNGAPRNPNDLTQEHYLKYSYMDYSQSNSPLMYALKSKGQSTDSGLDVNNGEVLLEAAIAGLGYILQPTFIVGEALKQGKLQIILPEFEPEPLGLYAVFPHRKLMTTKMRAFIDFISNYFGEVPIWDRF